MPVDLSTFPSSLATQLGISLFAGQLLASGIMIALFMFPTLFLSKKLRLTDAIPLITLFMSMGICVALAWFPVWCLGISVFILALLLAWKMKGLAG